ncbi:hypothetical protein NMY22_g2379 [Coprinellus aureogranulatus]|nr:hypothetical protein NMY22_g2379 [Coprinellus aureogranulatus]
MWGTALSLPKVLFFVLRYFIFVHMALCMSYGFPTGVSPDVCKTEFVRVAVSSFILVVASEWILFIRIWAFSGKNKKLLAFLVFQVVALHGGVKITLLVQFVRSIEFVGLPFGGLPCLPVKASDVYLSGMFALMLGSVTTVMSIMIFLAFRRHRNLETTLLSVFYRDGVFYFVFLSSKQTGILHILHGALTLVVVLAILNIIINTTSQVSIYRTSQAEPRES